MPPEPGFVDGIGYRHRVIAHSGERSVRLSYYNAHLRQGAHDHDEAHVSVVVAGSFEEIASDSRGICARGGMMRARTGGCRHAVSFASHGALIVTLPLHGDVDPALAQLQNWCLPARAMPFRRILKELLAGSTAEIAMTVAELSALCLPPPANLHRPPRWLLDARDRLMEEPAGTSIARLAEKAGVHRVYFARAFTKCFGLPPSAFRRRAMLDRALCAALAEGGSLIEAALQAGFADQSHLTRTTHEFLGVPPGRLRSLLC